MKTKLLYLFAALLGLFACKKATIVNPESVAAIIKSNNLNDTITTILFKDSSFCLYPHAAIRFEPIKDSTVVEYDWLPFKGSASSKIINKSGNYVLLKLHHDKIVDTIHFSVSQCDPQPQTIISLYIPNSFTPNNDKKNDTWAPVGTGIASIYFEVRNADGNLVFNSTSMSNPWDGVWKGTGTIGPSGVYMYYVAYTDITGKFTKLTGYLQLQR